MAVSTLQEALGGLQFSGSDNMWGLGATGLASALPALINPRGKFGTNLAVGLGGTLLTALLGYQARQQADASNLAQAGFVSQLLQPGITSEEQAAITRENPRLIPLAQSLQLGQAAARQSAAADLARMEMQATVDVKKANAIDAGTPYGGPSFDAAAGGIPGFGTKGENILNEAQKQLRDSEASRTFTAVKATLERLAAGVANVSATSDIDFAKGAIQLLEPGLATNQGETAAIEGSTSIPSLMKATLSKALSGGGTITIKQRAEILEIGKRAYETRAATYNQTFEQLKGNVLARTMRPELAAQVEERLGSGGRAQSYSNLVQTWFKVPGYDLGDASAESILSNLASGQLTQESLFGALAARDSAKVAPQQAFGSPSGLVVVPAGSAPTAIPGSNLASALSAGPMIVPAPVPTLSPQIATDRELAQQSLQALQAKGRLSWTPTDHSTYAALFSKYGGDNGR